MIVWINGAYGAGKTSCAYELQKRIPKAIVYDPENAGFFIRKNIPKELHKPDFQDHELWRMFNYEMLRYLAGSTDDIILVPMTLLCRRYYDEIIGRLTADGICVRHFILCAEGKRSKRGCTNVWKENTRGHGQKLSIAFTPSSRRLRKKKSPLTEKMSVQLRKKLPNGAVSHYQTTKRAP